MTEQSSAPGGGQARARGGQPGNRNAVRHGFYARPLPGDPPLPDLRSANRDLPGEGLPNLSDEIAMLRLAVREIVSRTSETEPAAEELRLLRSVSIAAGAINRLIKTQAVLSWDRLPQSEAAEEEQAALPANPDLAVTAEDLASARAVNVEGEIDLLRHFIQRVTRRQAEWETLEESAAMVRGLAIANVTLTKLLHTRKLLQKNAHSRLDFERRLRAIQRQLKDMTDWEE
ncbi:MAG: hypothetical protein ACYDHA_05220 [Bellilinea sp.]